MQFRQFIVALMMLVQVSDAAPQSSSDNSANSSGNSIHSLLDFNQKSPAYNNARNLYNQFSQIISNYNPQPSSNSGMGYIQNHMNNIGNKLLGGYGQDGPTISGQPVQPTQTTSTASQSTVTIQTPPPPPPPQVTSPTPQSSGSSSQFDANTFLQLVNEFRSQNGAGPVKLANALNEAAVQHNNYMISINTLTHNRSPGQDLETMIKQYGGTPGGSLGECVAEGYLTTQDVFNGWKNDEPHAAIMKDPDYTQIGVALNGSYSTAEFSS